MYENKNIWFIIFIALVIIMIYYIFFAQQNNNPQMVATSEYFTGAVNDYPHNLDDYSQNLGDYNVPTTNDTENNFIDKLVCHPSCCGGQWPVPFDGLNSEQLQKALADQKSGGPFVRTSYTCANGPNGVGCPCVPKSAYLNLVNRGQKSYSDQQIEQSLLINPNEKNKPNGYIYFGTFRMVGPNFQGE